MNAFAAQGYSNTTVNGNASIRIMDANEWEVYEASHDRSSSEPFVSINKATIGISRVVASQLTDYVVVMINRRTNQIAIRTATEDTPNRVKLSRSLKAGASITANRIYKAFGIDTKALKGRYTPTWLNDDTLVISLGK